MGTDQRESYQLQVPVRSKSHERFNQRSKSNLRVASKDRSYHSKSRNDSISSKKSNKAKHILSGAQETIDSMRREIVEKDRLIDKKNKEIVKLRMHCEDLQNQLETQAVTITQKERQKIMKEFDNSLEAICVELERAKINLFKEDSGKMKRSFQKNEINAIYQFSSEEKLLGLLKDRIKNMKGLVSMASEIFLLSQGKKKQGSGSYDNNQLLQENNLLQQNLYEYEKTLKDLDKIFRRDDSKDDKIFELKNVIDQQLKKIVKLQQDNDQL